VLELLPPAYQFPTVAEVCELDVGPRRRELVWLAVVLVSLCEALVSGCVVEVRVAVVVLSAAMVELWVALVDVWVCVVLPEHNSLALLQPQERHNLFPQTPVSRSLHTPDEFEAQPRHCIPFDQPSTSLP
jgi:hypothetical protein